MNRLAILVCVLFSCFPLLVPSQPLGISIGHDWRWELLRIAEYQHALTDGQWPPYFASNVFSGYGSPIFLFYPPLFSAIAAGFTFFGATIVQASALTLLALTAVGGFGIHGAALAAGAGSAGARIAVYLYLLHPYLIGDKFARNAHAEFAGLAFLPLVAWGVLTLLDSPRRAVLLLASGISLTLMAHNLTGLVAMAFVSVGSFFVVGRGGRTRRIAIALASGVVLGLGMAAFYWLPALLEQDLMRTGMLTTGRYDFHRNFAALVDVFGNEKFFSTGPATPLFLVGMIVLVYWRRSQPLTTLLAGALACLVLVFRISTPLWESLPWLPFFTFPWRFIGAAALLIALAGACAFALVVPSLSRRARWAAEGAVLIVCILSAMPRLTDVPLIRADIVPILNHQLAPQEIRTRPTRIGFVNEYLAPGAPLDQWRREPASLGPLASSSSPITEWSVVSQSGGRILLDLVAASDTRLELRRFGAPLWRAQRAGIPLETFTSAVGRLGVRIPAGRGTIELSVHQPLSRKIGLTISLFAWICFAVIAIHLRAKPGHHSGSEEDDAEPPTTPIAPFEKTKISNGSSAGKRIERSRRN